MLYMCSFRVLKLVPRDLIGGAPNKAAQFRLEAEALESNACVVLCLHKFVHSTVRTAALDCSPVQNGVARTRRTRRRGRRARLESGVQPPVGEPDSEAPLLPAGSPALASAFTFTCTFILVTSIANEH